jgi:AcrR family transcriptional regulator
VGAVPSTRDRILDAARRLYIGGGPAAVTVRAVERHSRLTAPTIYWHFRDMSEVVDAVVDDAFGGLAERLPTSLSAKTPHARLVATARVYRDYALEFPTLYAAMFLAPDRERNLSGEPGRTVGRRTFDFLVERVEECLSAKKVSRANAHEVAVRIWATAHGFLLLQIAGRIGVTRADFDTLYDRAIETLI